MAAEAARSGTTVDSYIGSLISLTSKSEIRYEGILYNINTEESSIGLRNVCLFGTEGRKDGPQIPASDEIYEYILFRGSDIKDLQVKSSPHPQAAPIHNDPAIIQSHYSRPPASTSSPSVGSVTVADNSHTVQLGQGGLPPYQPGASLGSWVSSPPAANESGLAMPTMYWQGYYAPTSGLPHMQQSSMLRSPPGLPVLPSMQQPLQYPAINSLISSGLTNLADYRSPLLPPVSSTPSVTSMTLPPTSAPVQAILLAPETLPSLMPNKPSAASLPASSIGPTLPFVPPLASSLESIATTAQSTPSVVGSKPRPPIATLPYQSTSQSVPSIIGSPISSHVETLVPLVTPSQLFQPGSSTMPSSQPSQIIVKEVESKLPELPESNAKLPVPEPGVSAPAEVKEPILPLPTPSDVRPYDTALRFHRNHRGHGRARGRGNGHPRSVTKFTEDFDFIAMNEKFNKDEVWGHLGRSKSQYRDREGDSKDDEVDDDEDDEEPLKLEAKPVYIKDDFFDSLSCNTLHRGSQNGKTKFSEQLKIDTETFGDFPRHRPYRGGGRSFRGGGRIRGSYYGRGYGYVGRGRGNTMAYRAS